MVVAGVQLEGLGSVRLQAKSGPDPADSGVRKSGLGGLGADRLVGPVLGRGVQGALDDLSHLRTGDSTRAAWPVLISGTLDTVLHEPAPLLADRVLVHTEALRDLFALRAICAQQDHPAPNR